MRFKVSQEKEASLLRRMEELGIRESEIVESFIKGSGSGGQKINKTSSCVYLRHTPTGIEVKCQRERSQALNRFLARRELCDKIERLQKGVIEKEQSAREKIRRQKRKRSRRAKEKMLANKKMRSTTKSLRQKVSDS